MKGRVVVLGEISGREAAALMVDGEALEGPLPLNEDARAALVASTDGDGRFLLGQAETLYNAKLPEPLDPAALGAFPLAESCLLTLCPDPVSRRHYNPAAFALASNKGGGVALALAHELRQLV